MPPDQNIYYMFVGEIPWFIKQIKAVVFGFCLEPVLSRIKSLTQGHNTVPPVTLEPVTPPSRGEHSITEPLCSYTHQLRQIHVSTAVNDLLWSAFWCLLHLFWDNKFYDSWSVNLSIINWPWKTDIYENIGWLTIGNKIKWHIFHKVFMNICLI